MAPVNHSVTLALCAEFDNLPLFAGLNAQHLLKMRHLLTNQGYFLAIFVPQIFVALVLSIAILSSSVIKAARCFCAHSLVLNVYFPLGGGRLVKDYCISLLRWTKHVNMTQSSHTREAMKHGFILVQGCLTSCQWCTVILTVTKRPLLPVKHGFLELNV